MPTRRRLRPSSATAPFAVVAAPVVLLVAVALVLPTPARGAQPWHAAVDAHRAAGPATAQQTATIDPFDLATVHDYKLTFDRADWESALAADQTVQADIEVDGVALADVAVAYKGNSSQRGAGRKKPLNITFDANVAGQTVGGHDVINFNNGFSDPTFVREALTSKSLSPFMPMPRIGWARVHVNGAYFGFYVAVEQIEGTFIKHWFRSNNGWRFKADPPEAAAPDIAAGDDDALSPDQRPGGGGFGASLAWLGEDLALYKSRYELKTPDAGDTAWTGLRELTRALDAPTGAGGAAEADLPAALADHLDVDRVLWYVAAMNLFANFDSYYVGHNYFLWRADEDERFHILAWDINESFGTFPGGGVDTADTAALARVDPFHMTSGSGAGPLLRRVVTNPAWRADYLAHYRTLLSAAFAPAGIERDGTAMQAIIAASVKSDPNPLYGTSFFEAGLLDDVRLAGGGGGGGGGGRPAPGIVKLVTLRTQHLAALPDLQPPAGNVYDATRDQTPGAPTSADDVLIGLRWDGAFLGEPPSTVSLRYAVDGGRTVELPMPSAVEGGLQQWRATIPQQPAGTDVTYYLRAVWPDGKVVFVPAANLTRPSTYTVAGVQLPPAADSDLVINEVLADNGVGDVDEAGEHEDWVELFNKGTAPIDLAGYFLSDDPTKPDAWQLPDVTLAPGAFLAIWCDEDGSQGPLHANFKLSKAGELVQLATRDAVVDSVTFGAQTTDVSWARQPDGTGAWASCASPTIGRANVCGGGTGGTATATGVASATPTVSATPSMPAITQTATATGTRPIVDVGTPTPTPTPTIWRDWMERLYLPIGYRLK